MKPYIKVKGQEQYLYRAVDSTGQTIEFLLTANRDAVTSNRFIRRALSHPGNLAPQENDSGRRTSQSED
jgi:transposase-like protein